MRSGFVIFFLGSAVAGWAAETPPAPSKPAEPSSDELYNLGKSLFDQYAPPEIKEQFEFPNKELWDQFATRLQRALDNNDLKELAAYEPEARAALVALRALPGYKDYADWLAERLDYIEAAKQASALPSPRPPAIRPTPQPGQPAPSPVFFIPYYDLWVQRVRARPVPLRAAKLMPELRAAFAAEGVPAELAWLAEAESTLNPSVRSPSGAKGLFQLMPNTARALGLSTFLPDDRGDTTKSARAAAHYLRTLHATFGEWPLVFAAYNAGEGRVRRLLAANNATTFGEISAALPSETRMYVPKVCATVAVRSGVSPERLTAPRA